MNKIVFIGDIHGHDSWKAIVKQHHDADKIVFIGDYFDSFSVTPAVQIDNYKQIIQLKESNPDQVVLLIGNHDFHYMQGCNERYGGWNAWFAPEIGELLRETGHLLQIAWQYENILATHAGVSNTWFRLFAPDHDNIFEIGYEINKQWEEDARVFKHAGLDVYGNSKMDGPLWIRPRALKSDPLNTDLVQIVGHTNMSLIDYDDSHYFIDTLPNEYLVWQDDEFIIHKC